MARTDFLSDENVRQICKEFATIPMHRTDLLPKAVPNSSGMYMRAPKDQYIPPRPGKVHHMTSQYQRITGEDISGRFFEELRKDKFPTFSPHELPYETGQVMPTRTRPNIARMTYATTIEPLIATPQVPPPETPETPETPPIAMPEVPDGASNYATEDEEEATTSSVRVQGPAFVEEEAVAEERGSSGSSRGFLPRSRTPTFQETVEGFGYAFDPVQNLPSPVNRPVETRATPSSPESTVNLVSPPSPVVRLGTGTRQLINRIFTPTRARINPVETERV